MVEELVHHQDDLLSVVSLGGVCTVVPRGTPSPETASNLRVALNAAASAANPCFIALFVVPEKVRLPSDVVRSTIRATLGEVADKLGAVGAVVQGAGFLVSAKRSILTFVTSTLSGRVPVRVFADLDEALVWAAHSAGQLKLESPSAANLQIFLRRADWPRSRGNGPQG